jgi:hypothetical protein
MALKSVTCLNRGATVAFQSNFYDYNNNLVQPASAFVNVDYPNPDGSRSEIDIPMTPGSSVPLVPWLALWDTRGAGPGTVYYSVHTGSPSPVAVGDGFFEMTANAANLVSF